MNISDEQIKKIFELASMNYKLSKGEISPDDISEALIAIERKIYSFAPDTKSDTVGVKKVLIVDDLELSIYQLTNLLKKIGIEPVVSRTKDEAVSELQKVQFDCAIVDLFLPDSAEGFDLIQKLVDKRIYEGSKSTIVVISGTDDKTMIDACYDMGVDFYIQKDKDWHTKLLKFLSNSLQSDDCTSFSKQVVGESITSYQIKKLNETNVFEDLKKNVNAGIYSGFKNVIFDLSSIVTFDVENAYIFADIYKICAENGGKLVLVNPSVNIKEAMDFAYLTDVIPYANSIEEATSLV